MQPEEIKPYDAEGSKGEQVETMFDSIAPAYDFMNTAMTFGMHRRWLRKALEAAIGTLLQGGNHSGATAPEVLDLATGTGDVAFKIADLLGGARITGVDLSEGMLREAAQKAKNRNADIRFVQGDCLDLQFSDNSFDLLTIAYGVRNFENLERGFREFYRVLKPGASFMILELSRPENGVIRLGYDLYASCVIPLIGRVVSKDRCAYSYLPQSIAAMPSRAKVASMLRDAGFRDVGYKSLTLGVVTYYIGRK